jgi:hypothetical protein
MQTLEEIERAIRRLSPDELAAFRMWFAEFDAEVWDQQIERDTQNGRLDQLAFEALADLRDGRCTEM